MDFFVDLFWVLFATACLTLLIILIYTQHQIKKEQEYLIKLNHEILEKLTKKESG